MRVLFFALLLILSNFSYANNSDIKACKSTEKLAISIMKSRQYGIPMSKLYELDTAKDNPAMDKAIKQMIVDAYEQPVFSSIEMKEHMIREYGDSAFLHCIK